MSDGGRTTGGAGPTLCPVCAHAGGFEPSLEFHRSAWPVLRCPGCTTQFVWPLPTAEQIAELYDFSRFGAPTYGLSRHYAEFRARMFSHILDLAEAKLGHRGKVLDVGCSSGAFLEVAHARGWVPFGTEIDAATARTAGRRLGIEVSVGPGVTPALPSGPFDLIVLSHCLEHIPNPLDLMREAVSALSSQGVVAVRVPNARSSVARLTGAYWSWFTPPGHLMYFSSDSIQVLAGLAGLRTVHTEFARGDALGLPLEAAVSLLRWMGGWQSTPGMKPKVLADSTWVGKGLSWAREFSARASQVLPDAVLGANDSELICVVARDPSHASTVPGG